MFDDELEEIEFLLSLDEEVVDVLLLEELLDSFEHEATPPATTPPTMLSAPNPNKYFII